MDRQVQQKVMSFNRMFRAYDGIYSTAARKFDIPELSLWIIYGIRQLPDCTQKDIADFVMQPRQSVNSAVKRLMVDGYVCSEPLADDRRAKVLHLTDKGEELASRTADFIIEAEERAICSLPESDWDKFTEFFERLSGAMEKEFTECAGGHASQQTEDE